MSQLARVSLALSGVLLCAATTAGVATANAEEEAGPQLRHWQAPAFFSPVHTTPVVEGAHGAGRTALAAPPSAYAFVAISPCRQYDSRSVTPLLSGTPRNVLLAGAPCNIPAGVAAVSVNIAIFNIVGTASNGVFTVGLPAGSSQAWINYAPAVGQIDNAGAVAVNASGVISVTVNQGGGSVDFVVDVNGYYTLDGIVAASAATSTSFTGALAGDVTGTQGATVVSTVGGSTAANVNLAELAANAATTSNTANTIVKRDASGNVSALGYTQSGPGGETLRTIRGIFSGTTGATVAGSGFSAVRNSVGQYTITFSQAFSGFPVITVSIMTYGNGWALINTVGYVGVNLASYDKTGTLSDHNISFIAIGPP